MLAFSERLEKLNSYLISKGRPPRAAVGVNFVKQNIGNIRKKKPSGNLNRSNQIVTSSLPNKSHKQDEQVKSHTGTKNINTSLTKTAFCKMKSGSTLKHVGVKTLTSKISRQKENKIWTPKSQRAAPGNPRRQDGHARKTGANIPESLYSKPHTSCKTPQSVANIVPRPNKNMGSDSLSGASNTPVCKSTGPRLPSKTRISQNTKSHNGSCEEEQLKLYQKLNHWLISKGKKPLTGKKLRGFKPTKTIATPVSSPFHPSKPATNGSHWQVSSLFFLCTIIAKQIIMICISIDTTDEKWCDSF